MSATTPSPTPAERAAFKRAEVRAAGDLMCSHDQAWLDAVLSEERLLTVAWIRTEIAAYDYDRGDHRYGWKDWIRRLLDEVEPTR